MGLKSVKGFLGKYNKFIWGGVFWKKYQKFFSLENFETGFGKCARIWEIFLRQKSWSCTWKILIIFFLRNYRTLFRAVVFRKKIRNFFQGKILSLGAEKCGTRPLWNSLLILTIIIVLFFPSFFLLIVIMVIVIINIILFHNKTRF